MAAMMFIVVMILFTTACSKDGAATSGGGSTPVNPNQYDDPEGTIMANLRNDGGSITILYRELKINSANNFIQGGNNNDLYFANVGEVEGLGYVNSVPQSGWTNQVSVIPENGYVVRKQCSIFKEDKEVYYEYARIYVTRYITNSNDEILGAEIKYQDNWQLYPTVTTKDVTEITANTAICGGNVTFVGSGYMLEYGVCWSTSHEPTIDDSHQTSWVDENGDYTVQITGLSPNETYYVRAYAKNSDGIGYGDEKTFTTMEVVLPSIVLEEILDFSSSAALCCVNLTSDGYGTVFYMGLCWSTQENPTLNDIFIDTEVESGIYEITGLTSNTEYYVKAFATNEAGTSYSNQMTFVTTNEPLPPTPWQNPAPGPGGTIPSSIIPEALYNEITSYFNVCSGENPPRIKGEFVSRPHVLIHSTMDEMPGTVYNDRYFALYEYNGLVDYFGKQWDDALGDYNYESYNLYIIGSGDMFTCYFITEGYPSGMYAKQSTIMSGRWDASYGGVRDFQMAVILLETSGNPNLAPVNSYRIIGDGDGLSENNPWLGGKEMFGNKNVSDDDLFRLFKIK